MILSAIVAVAGNGVIGRDNALPWRLSTDLKRFKKLTTGHALIMGRKTFESIGKPLPERRSIVLTRDRDFAADGITVVHSLQEALAESSREEEAFVIGGASVFREALPGTDRLYLTRVHADVPGDVFLPEIDWSSWARTEQHSVPADEKNQYPTTFEVYVRKAGCLGHDRPLGP